jgi:hypothetical protein
MQKIAIDLGSKGRQVANLDGVRRVALIHLLHLPLGLLLLLQLQLPRLSKQVMDLCMGEVYQCGAT